MTPLDISEDLLISISREQRAALTCEYDRLLNEGYTDEEIEEIYDDHYDD